MCLTFIFKVNNQGQVSDFVCFEILDISGANWGGGRAGGPSPLPKIPNFFLLVSLI